MQTRPRVSRGAKRVLTPLATLLPLSVAATTPMTPPGSMRRIHDSKMNIQDLDEDERMRNRASLDSNASTILGEDEGAFEDEYLWTDDQIAMVLRTVEEGNPPSVTEWTPPTTPYVLPFLPTNLVDLWARQLKRSTDWPHSVRAIRSKLRNTAKIVAKSRHTNTFNEQAEDGMRANPDRLHKPDDDLIISPTLEVPSGRRNDAAVYKSSLKVQQNEDVLSLGSLGYQYHPYTWSRPRSPVKTPRSPSVEPVSPIDSYFPGGMRNRSRSVSPFPTINTRDSNTMDHDGTPPPVPPKDGQVPSLSPMKLSPKKGERSTRSPDPSDLLAFFPPRTSHARAPIPMMFTRDEMRSGSELQNQAQIQAQAQPSSQLQSDGFFSAGLGDEVSSPATVSTGTGRTPFSSISSISSLISSHSITSSNADSTRSLGPLYQQRGLHRKPSLPPPAMTGLRTHLSEFTDRRSGLKRSSSFSKPSDPIKRAPSYGNVKELPNPREAISSNLSNSTATIRDNSESSWEPQGPTGLLGHKRERSDSSIESTSYDTEDVPPSSAPSSGLISQRSPVKSIYETPPKPLPGSPLKAPFDPERAFTPSPSPTKMLEAPQSLTKRLLGSPSLLPSRLFGKKKKSFRKKDKNGSDKGSGREITASLSPSPAPSLGLPMSPGLLSSPGGDIPPSPSSTGVPISPMSSGFPVSPITSRFPDSFSPDSMDVEMEIDNTPTQLPNGLGLVGPNYRLIGPDSPGYGLGGSGDQTTQRYRRSSTHGRVSRKPSFEPRREGEPRRKRVKTDELATPPRELPDIGSPDETRYAPRAKSPTAFSEGTPRHLIRSSTRLSRARSNAPKTPPSRRVAKSPRLLAGAGRNNSMTNETNPLPPPLPSAIKSTPMPTVSTAAASNSASTITPTNSTITPTQPRRPTSFLMSRTAGSSTVMAATAASKAKQANIVKSPRNAPKREPSFLNAPLLPAARARAEESQKGKEAIKETGSTRRVGTTRFPAISTASISSVLFPGGATPSATSDLDQVPESAPAHITEFQIGTIGTGEEGVIRAGESAAHARRAGNTKSRGAGSRGALSGVTRSRMGRSISMLGPGERPAPY